MNKNAGLVCQLAGLKKFSASEKSGKPKNAAAIISGQMQIYLHEAVNVEAERQRLEKQKQQLEQAKKGLEVKLANDNFISRAKPEVVAQTKEKFKELAEQLTAVEKHLSQLEN